MSYYSDCPDLDFCTETQEIFPFLKITRFGADFPRSCTGNNFYSTLSEGRVILSKCAGQLTARNGKIGLEF